MTHTERLAQEFLVCGLTGYTGSETNGVPNFNPPLGPVPASLALLINQKHVADDLTYTRQTNLRTHAADIFNHVLVTPDYWDAYRRLQRDAINSARREAKMSAAILGCVVDCACEPGNVTLQNDLKIAVLAINAALPYLSEVE